MKTDMSEFKKEMSSLKKQISDSNSINKEQIDQVIKKIDDGAIII